MQHEEFTQIARSGHHQVSSGFLFWTGRLISSLFPTGRPIWGESTLQPWIQTVAHHNSQFAHMKFSTIPWFNFVKLSVYIASSCLITPRRECVYVRGGGGFFFQVDNILTRLMLENLNLTSYQQPSLPWCWCLEILRRRKGMETRKWHRRLSARSHICPPFTQNRDCVSMLLPSFPCKCKFIELSHLAFESICLWNYILNLTNPCSSSHGTNPIQQTDQ
jgi:hypothetical protein